tara:strand:- start:45 stop:512 length:468 start_codon:yes stop_codon:yes gene_type:complete
METEDILKKFEMNCESEASLVWIATQEKNTPHLVPVCFVKYVNEDKLMIANVYISKTIKNIKGGSEVAIGLSFMDKGGRDGYLLKGKAQIIEKGTQDTPDHDIINISSYFEKFSQDIVNKTGGKRKPNSAILVYVKQIYSLKPYKGKKKIWETEF